MNPTTGPGAGSRSEFARLGTGGRDDRLRLRLVLQVLWRTLPLLASVKRHLLAFVAALVTGLLVGLPVLLLMLDVLFTRVLDGQPLTELEARVLLLDPELYAEAGAADTGSEELRDPALPAERRQVVRNRWVVALVLMSVIGLPFGAGLLYYAIWILQRINQTLRVHLLERIQTLSLRFHAESRVGDSVYRLFQDSAMVTNVIEMLFLRPVWYVFAHLVGLAVVFSLDPILGAVLLISWPPAALLAGRFSPRMRAEFRSARERNSALTSRIQETLAGIKVIKANHVEAREQARFESDSLAAFTAAYRARDLYAVYGILAFWVPGSVLIAALVRAALLGSQGSPLFAQTLLGAFGFTVWNLGLFSFARSRIGQGTGSIEQLLLLWGRVQDTAIGLDRVYELLDLEPEVQDAADARDLSGLQHGIVFKGVRFGYRPDEPVLREVDLEASRGTITAIVGPTGSGKSTLMALLLRLFDPDRGSIEIDGSDLRALRLESLRGAIAIALQENILFATTVRENIRYAVPSADDERVRQAARVACADEFIRKLPQGYDTLLGERGTRLSTGQRQRLSIARAVLKDTPILVLDEPTAALDAETELRVLRNLTEWGRGRAIFLVAHRLSTIRRADQIVYLGEGRVLERGSHEELVARPNGAYSRFVALEEAGTEMLAAGGT